MRKGNLMSMLVLAPMLATAREFGMRDCTAAPEPEEGEREKRMEDWKLFLDLQTRYPNHDAASQLSEEEGRLLEILMVRGHQVAREMPQYLSLKDELARDPVIALFGVEVAEQLAGVIENDPFGQWDSRGATIETLSFKPAIEEMGKLAPKAKVKPLDFYSEPKLVRLPQGQNPHRPKLDAHWSIKRRRGMKVVKRRKG